MNSYKFYRIVTEKYPTGFTWGQGLKEVNSSGILQNNLKVLTKNGFLLKQASRARTATKNKQSSFYIPIYFRCKANCKVVANLKEILAQISDMAKEEDQT